MTTDQKPEAQAVAPDFLANGHTAYAASVVACWPEHNRARFNVPLFTRATLDAAIAEAVAKGRERCAQVCEDISDEYQRTEGRKYPELKSDAETGADACAAAIRTAQERT